MKYIKYLILISILTTIICIVEWRLSLINPYSIILTNETNTYKVGDSIGYEYSIVNYSLLLKETKASCMSIGGQLRVVNLSKTSNNTIMLEDSMCLTSVSFSTTYPFGTIETGYSSFVLIDDTKDCHDIEPFSSYILECRNGIKVQKGLNEIRIGPEKYGKIVNINIE